MKPNLTILFEEKDQENDVEHIIKEDKINIFLYLPKYKKVNINKIAERINNIFLIEYICALTRLDRKNQAALCESEENERKVRCSCVCEYPLKKGMRLRVQ
jgi:hypothetical protein